MSTAIARLLHDAPRSSPLGPALGWALDGVGAVVFAYALSKALTALPEGGLALWTWLAGVAAAGCVRAGAVWFATLAGADRSRRLKRHLRERVLRTAMQVRAGEAATLGERLAAVTEQVEAMDGWFARFEALKLASGLTPALILAAVAVASPISALILLAALVPFTALMIFAGGAAADAARLQLQALTRLSGMFVDRLRGLPIVIAFQDERRQTALLATASRAVADRTLKVLKIAFVSSAGLEFFSALSVALVAVYAGFNLLRLLPIAVPEQLDLQRAVFVLALAPEFYAPLRRMAAAYHDKQAAAAAAERLAALLESPRIAASTAVVPAAAPSVEFQDVVIRYEEGPEIGPLSFVAPAGRITAIVGASGAGKTSLLASLVGLSPLVRGEILMGGQRLSEVGSFAPAIGWAGQRPALAPGALADNVRLGRSDASDAEVAQAVEEAGLRPTVERRPEGLDTVLDERGSGLSGGERRRIGLARAGLKRAPILVVDEPTADLDDQSEASVMAWLRRAAGSRTVVLATHSERVAAMADKVVRL